MPDSLSAVPAAQRRVAARALGVVSPLLIVVGLLCWLSGAPAVIRVLATLVLLTGLVTAAVAWGLAHSLTLDARRADEQALDAVLETVGGGCSCGHDHDPTEMHITDCSPDSHDCTHSCETCVLAGLRDAPPTARKQSA